MLEMVFKKQCDLEAWLDSYFLSNLGITDKVKPNRVSERSRDIFPGVRGHLCKVNDVATMMKNWILLSTF